MVVLANVLFWLPSARLFCIAMEHLADDPVRIPEVVFAESPTYRIACGDCIDEITKARPDVLFFR